MSIFILFEHGCRHAVGDIHLHDLLHHIIHQNEQILTNQETIMPAPEIARLKAVADALTSLDTTVTAADPGAPAASTPPADTGTQNPAADSGSPAGSTDTGSTDAGNTDSPAS